MFSLRPLQQRRVPWIRAILKAQKQKVFARADANGAFLVQSGRVEIRYNAKDGRFYEARASNLEPVADSPLIPDESMGPAERVAQSAPAASNSMKLGTKSAELAKIDQRRAATGAQGSQKNAPHLSVPHGTVVAYADGACSGNPGPAGFGIVILDGKERTEICHYLGEATNNIAELSAVLRALQEVSDKGKPLIIWTDSQYSIGILQKGWKAKANVELVEQLKEALRKRPADIRYVPGHSGIALNERADELAREAISRRNSWKDAKPVEEDIG